MLSCTGHPDLFGDLPVDLPLTLTSAVQLAVELAPDREHKAVQEHLGQPLPLTLIIDGGGAVPPGANPMGVKRIETNGLQLVPPLGKLKLF